MRFASSTSCAAVSSGNLADVLEEELERVGGDLARLGLQVEVRLLVGARRRPRCAAPRAPCRARRAAGLELVAQRERNLLVREKSCLLALAHERLGVFVIEQHGRLAPLPLLRSPNPLLLNVAGSRNLSTAALRRICRMCVATLARLPDVRHGPMAHLVPGLPVEARPVRALKTLEEALGFPGVEAVRGLPRARGWSWRIASSTCPIQESSEPEVVADDAALGPPEASGPRREKVCEGSSLSKRPTRGGDARRQVVRVGAAAASKRSLAESGLPTRWSAMPYASFSSTPPAAARRSSSSSCSWGSGPRGPAAPRSVRRTAGGPARSPGGECRRRGPRPASRAPGARPRATHARRPRSSPSARRAKPRWRRTTPLSGCSATSASRRSTVPSGQEAMAAPTAASTESGFAASSSSKLARACCALAVVELLLRARGARGPRRRP